MKGDLSELIAIMTEMVQEQRQMNSFLVQIVAHNADLMEQDGGGEELELDLSGNQIL
jgi:hypothetical protein